MGELVKMAGVLAKIRAAQEAQLTGTDGSTRNTRTSRIAWACEKCHDRGGFGQIGTLFGELSWREFCDCELGQQQKSEIEAKERAWRKHQEEWRVQRVFTWTDEPAMYADWSLETYPARGDQHALAVCRRFVERRDPDKHSLLLMGPPGRGKTGLVVGTVKALTAKGELCLFVQTQVYLNRLRDSFALKTMAETRPDAIEGIAWASPDQIREVAQTVPVLALDDFGNPDRYDVGAKLDWQREEMFILINYRYTHRLPTIVVTNLSDARLEAQFGERTLQRLKHMSTTLVLNGANLRERTS